MDNLKVSRILQKNVAPILSVYIDQALTLCPKEVVDYIGDKCIFISCSRDGRPWVSPIKIHFKDGVDYFIFLPCQIKDMEEKKRNYFILHEVAHAYLKHTGENVKKDDEEAKRLAESWMSE